MKSSFLTLGELRAFVQKFQNAPDNVPVTISIPTRFNCEEEFEYLLDRLTEDEVHEPNEYDSINACGINFVGFDANSSTSSDGYIPPNEWEPGEDWDFHVDIAVRPEEAHDLLAGCDFSYAEEEEEVDANG